MVYLGLGKLSLFPSKMNNKTRLEGHQQGVQSVRNIIQKSLDIGLKNLTLYTFSKNNWKILRLNITANFINASKKHTLNYFYPFFFQFF